MPCPAFRPTGIVQGSIFIIYGSNLGPSSIVNAAAGGNTDTGLNVFASVGPQPTVWIGGVSASIAYYGRSPGAGAGLDQINFTVPQGVSGCNVAWALLAIPVGKRDDAVHYRERGTSHCARDEFRGYVPEQHHERGRCLEPGFRPIRQ
jgi:hypothetical protein